MKICTFSPEELKAIFSAMDYVEFCLEGLDTNPDGWNDEKAASVFTSARKKLILPSKDASITKDECILLGSLLHHYLSTSQPWDSPREEPEDARHALSAIQKIEQFPSV